MRKHIDRKEGLRRQAGRIVAVLAVMAMLTGFAASGTVAHAANACTPDEEKREGYATYTLTADCVMHVGPGMMRDAYINNGGVYVGPFSMQKHNIRSIIIDDPANTRLPDQADDLFRYPALEHIDGLDGLNVANVTSMRRMFENDSQLSGVLDLAHWDVSHVVSMADMFSKTGDGSLILRTTGWDTRSVTDMSGMFSTFGGFPHDIGSLDVSHTEDFSRMFAFFTPPMAIDLSAWDTSSATQMWSMFIRADVGLIKGIDSLNVSKVRNFRFMFQGATNSAGEYGNIDLSAWRTESAEDMTYMFSETDLGYFKGISGLDTSHVTSLSGVFRDSKTAGTHTDISSWDTSKATDMSQMFMGDDLDDFTGIDGLDISAAKNLNGIFSSAHSSTPLDLSAWDTGSATDMGFMFSSFQGTVKGLEGFNTSSAVYFWSMFQDMKAASPIDLSAWDTRNASNTRQMFAGSEGFFGMDSWNTSKLYTAYSMFESAKPAKPLDLSSWDTSNVTDMGRMFLNMQGTLTIDRPWNTSKVTDMSAMFANLPHPRINLAGADTSKVTNMNSMFYGLDLSEVKGIPDLNVGGVTDFRGMFAGASIDHLDLSKWDKQSTARDGYMLMLDQFTDITTGSNMRIHDDPFNYGYDINADPAPPYGQTIWRYDRYHVTGAWSQIPDNPDDPASYWTSQGLREKADRELIDRINSGQAGTWVMTRTRDVSFNCMRECSGRPNWIRITWPVSPDSSRLPDNAPTSKNWKFKGWMPANADNGTHEPINPGERIPAEVMLSKNWPSIMNAQWERIQRTITYHDDSGDGQGMPQPSIVDSGDGFTLPATAPTRRGYGFVGWRIDGGTTIYQPGARIPEVTSDITLHAVWSAPVSRLPAAGEHADRRLMIAVLALLVSAMIAGAFLRMSKRDGRGRHRRHRA